MVSQQLQKALEGLVVLVAEANPYLRRLTRMMLMNLGVKSIYESIDGIADEQFVRNVVDVLYERGRSAERRSSPKTRRELSEPTQPA